MQGVLVTAKINPDLDGVASALAYAEFTGAFPAFFGKLQAEPEFVLKKLKIRPVMNPLGSFSGFVLVDMSSTRGMPKVVDPKRVLMVIDHRPVDLNHVRRIFPNAKILIEPVGAAATIVAEMMKEIGRKTACLIYGAIISNTLNLRSKVTTERDLKVLERCRSICKKAPKLAREMLVYKTEKYLSALEDAIRADFKEWGPFGIAQLEVFGAEKFLERLNELIEILDKIRKEKKLEYTVLNIPDIKAGKTYVIFADQASAGFFGRVLGRSFRFPVAELDGCVLRKEYRKHFLSMIQL